MEYTSVLSLMFFISFAICCILGVYVISLNKKSIINRLFIVVCFCIGIWGFGFSMVNISKELEEAIIWRRFAALGWGSLFSFVLHFIIRLTDPEKENKVLSNKFVIMIIYLPGIICSSVYSLFSGIAIKQYQLVFSENGWVNVAKNTSWDWFYNFYYISFTMISLILLLLWGIKSKNRNVKII